MVWAKDGMNQRFSRWFGYARYGNRKIQQGHLMFQSMTIKLLSSAGCFGACLALAAQAPVQPQQDSEAALDTINLINHINYSVEVIRTYNNVIALEEEYQKISVDNLNLNRIRDEEALQLIRDISGVCRNCGCCGE